MGLDDFLDHFNLIDRAQGIIWGLKTWLPRRKSHKGRKVGKLRIDGGTCEIRVDRLVNTGGEAERVLAAAHIPIAGRRIRTKEAIFKVYRRQAAWAELVLLRAGVKLADSHKMIDPKNAQYAADKGPVPLWGGAQALLTDAYGKELKPARGKPQGKGKGKPAAGKLGRVVNGLNKLMEEE